jgi:FAD/FMN-containing dehydrogenase/Fe-S oxidoreductase
MTSCALKALRLIEGLDVFDDEMTLEIYSQDASIFHIRPLAVAWPRHLDHLKSIVGVCKQEGVAIIARGAATSVTGAPLGAGLCLDFSRYMNKILEIDPLSKTAWVEPGVVQDSLNEAASRYNLRLGPDTSTGNRATIGGMIANNSAGAHSLAFGMMQDHVEAIEVLLSSGRSVVLEKEHALSSALEDPDLRRVIAWFEKWKSQKEKLSFPKTARNSAGYLIEKLLSNETSFLNLAQAFCASEGTLGLICKAKVRLCDKPAKTAIWLLGYNSLKEAFEEAPALAALHPYACELIDDNILEACRQSPDPSMRAISWIHGQARAFIGFEISGSESQLKAKGSELSAFSSIASYQVKLESALEQQQFWKVRKGGVGLLMSKPGASKAIAFIEDLTVPLQHISAFLEGLKRILESEHKKAGIYGHIVAGCFHIRPYINLKDESDENKLWKISKACAELVKSLEGSLTGGHGDGLVRSWLNKDFFDSHLFDAFKEFKAAFDPHGLMNPGKIIASTIPHEQLRQSCHEKEAIVPTFLDFQKEGGFHEAVRKCNGNGNCRKAEGIMCPSFQVTHEERHSTRARAVALQGLAEGRLSPNLIASQEIKEILDLCLECKGCVRECPSSVDMAKLKSEMLYHYQKAQGLTTRSLLLSHFGPLSHIGSYLPQSFKEIPHRELALRLFDWLGFAKERPLPLLKKKPLRKIWKNRYTREEATVWVYADTYASFYEPIQGLDALTLLEMAGHRPYLLPYKCCGRPAFSKGHLELAHRLASQALNMLQPHDQEKRPIVVLEPSCRSLFSHDLLGLIPTPRAQILQHRVRSFESLLLEKGIDLLRAKRIKLLETHPAAASAWHVHLHCHERSLEGEQVIEKLAEQLEIQLHLLPSGCCGMAGSFGFEQEHYELSVAIAEQKIAPAIRKLDSQASLIASGTSCRSQWDHVCARKALPSASALIDLFKTPL